MSAQRKICNKTLEEIRKAYFDNDLLKLIHSIQSDDSVTQEQADELEEYLTRLKKEDEELRNRLSAKFNVAGSAEIKPPTVEELVGEVDEEAVAKWVEKKDNDMRRVRQIIAAVSNNAQKNGLTRDVMENLLLELEALRSSVDQDRVHKDQLYHQKIIEIIDRHMVSRREAEDRSKITKEYREYKLATLFADNFENFAIALRKKISNGY